MHLVRWGYVENRERSRDNRGTFILVDFTEVNIPAKEEAELTARLNHGRHTDITRCHAGLGGCRNQTQRESVTELKCFTLAHQNNKPNNIQDVGHYTRPPKNHRVSSKEYTTT